MDRIRPKDFRKIPFPYPNEFDHLFNSYEMPCGTAEATYSKESPDMLKDLNRAAYAFKFAELKEKILKRRIQRLLDGKIKQIKYNGKTMMLNPLNKKEMLVIDHEKIEKSFKKLEEKLEEMPCDDFIEFQKLEPIWERRF